MEPTPPSSPGAGGTDWAFDESDPFDAPTEDSGEGFPLLEDTDFDLGASLREVKKVLEQKPPGFTVLVADDDDNTCRIVSRYLATAGIQSVEDNGRSVILKALNHKVDLVLLDIMFPHTTGYEILRQIRAHEKISALPVVMCTGRKDKESIVRAAALGASGYVLKPFNRDTLLSKIEEIRKKIALSGAPSAPIEAPPPPKTAPGGAPPPAVRSAPSVRPVAAKGTDLPILIIDDEKIARHVLKVILEQSGYQVVEATRGEEGLRLLTQQSVAAIFLDLSMPGLSGFDVAERVRANPKTASIPIIFCTARSSRDDVLTAVKMGIRLFVRKPFTREIILAKIGEALGEGASEAGAEIPKA